MSETPSYRRQKSKQFDRAFVELGGQRFYLGTYGTPASRQKFHRLVAEWLANDQQLPVEGKDLTIAELLIRFWRHAEQYYRKWYWRTGGAVASSTENSVRLKNPVIEEVKRCPGSHLVIYAGTGAGQFALVDTAEDDTLKIRGRWQVIPDETSRVAVVNGFEGNQILGNRVERSTTGICLWGSSFQCQIIGNTLSDISGAAVAAFGLHLSACKDAAGTQFPTLAPCWYTQIHSNTILRAVGKPDQAMIVLGYQKYPKKQPDPFTNYGNSVRGNTIFGAPTAVELDNQMQSEVVGNTLSACGAAIRLRATCKDCSVEPNTLIGCGTATTRPAGP